MNVRKLNRQRALALRVNAPFSFKPKFVIIIIFEMKRRFVTFCSYHTTKQTALKFKKHCTLLANANLRLRVMSLWHDKKIKRRIYYK